ncbi:hypothetical protein N9N71_02970 [Synechococcus sp. AH-229-G18]|nr:hypothetical protein [Synechococcus sp. AH-229-G18]
MTSGTDDDEGRLTTTYQNIGGVGTARSVQINAVCEFSSVDDQLIIQLQKRDADNNLTTKNLTFGYTEFNADNPYSFTAGPYRLQSTFRGFGVEGARIGLSSTVTVENCNLSAVC